MGKAVAHVEPDVPVVGVPGERVLVATWPDPPWTLLWIGGIALMIVAPFAFFPFSKTLFLAFDLVFRPAARDELAAPDSTPRPR